MAAEALIVEDAYQKGYADAMADMRKKKEQRRQREQEKKARRWYFIKQKAYGLAMLLFTVHLLAGTGRRGGAVAAGRHCRAAGTVSEPPV